VVASGIVSGRIAVSFHASRMAEGGDPPVPEAQANEREAAKSTFFTSIDAEPRVKHKDAGKKQELQKFSVLESTPSGPHILEHHQNLRNLAFTLDERMKALLQEHEKDFFLAYKTHMYTVQREIKTLRMKAEKEEAKTRDDPNIKALEGELDWFVTEAVRLDELCRGYKKEVDKWKAQADALDEDRRFLEDQIKGAKRQNKILRAAADRARSSAFSALMATRARAESQALEAGDGGYPPLSNAIEQQAAPQRRQRAHSATAKPSHLGVRRDALEGRARTPDLPPTPLASASARVLALRDGGLGLDVSLPQAAAAETLPQLPGGRHVLGTDAEQRYVEAIEHLKDSIVREKQTVRMLQAVRASTYTQKSEMEEFFLKCVDEARKEMMRKSHLTLNQEKTEKQRVLEAMLSNEDVLVCLYEKLFPHRTGIARSLGVVAGEEVRSLAHMASAEA